MTLLTPSPIPSTTETRATQSLQAPSLSTFIRSLLPSILLNGVCVLIIYQLVKDLTPASDVTALFLSALPALLGTIITLIRQRTIDVLGAFTLITIAASLGLTFITSDARLFLIRESFVTVLFGILCLISLLFPKPIWYYIIRYFATGNNQALMVEYQAAWKFPNFRAYIRNITILWAITYLVEFLLRLVLVYTLSITQFLLISPFIFYGLTILVSIATLRSGQNLRKRRIQSNQPPATDTDSLAQ